MSANDSHVDIAEPGSPSVVEPAVVPMLNEASDAVGPVTEPAADTPRNSATDRSVGTPAEDPVALVAPTSAGQALTRARVAKGLGVEDVSRQLKLSVAQVNALEADNHVNLPAPVFVRGFLRSYARFVGADISAFLPAKATPVVDATLPPPAPVVHGRMMRQQAGAAVMEQRSYGRWLWAAGIVACLVGALAYYEFVLNVSGAAPTVVSVDAAKSVEQSAPSTVSSSARAPAPAPTRHCTGSVTRPARN